MKRAYLFKKSALLTAAITIVLLLGSFTSLRAQENNDQQVPASVQKRESMVSILESLEKNEPYTRDHNWGVPYSFPPQVYLPPVPWPEDFDFDFDFSFAGDIIDNIDFERIEKDLEEISRKIEIRMERVIRDLEKRGECWKR